MSKNWIRGVRGLASALPCPLAEESSAKAEGGPLAWFSNMIQNCTGIKPILADVDACADDPIGALAEKYFKLPCSVKTANRARLDLLRQLVAEYRPQCLIELIWQACLTYDVESFCIKRLAEEELGLPYLRIETDYSPSDSARIAVRVEALFETIHGSAQRMKG